MLTFKNNRDGTIGAAYLGLCRVGYVSESAGADWLWCTNLLRPTGGVWHGRASDRAGAERAVDEAVREWLAAAGVSRGERE